MSSILNYLLFVLVLLCTCGFFQEAMSYNYGRGNGYGGGYGNGRGYGYGGGYGNGGGYGYGGSYGGYGGGAHHW